VRSPLSLKKIKYEPFKGRVLFKTKYNEYFGENFKVYTGENFISALAQHIPPAKVHLVRYYGLYSSRTKGIWEDIPNIVRLAPAACASSKRSARPAPEGFSKKKDTDEVADDTGVKDVKGSAKRSAWTRMINKVYGIDPLICSKCGSEMRIVAFIMEAEQIEKIMQHLIKQGRAPPSITQS
jgi:hypothetical protein